MDPVNEDTHTANEDATATPNSGFASKFDTRIDARPKALNRLMIVPIILALMLAFATGVLVLKMTEERQATGARVSYQLTGTCLSDAEATILKRATDVGVGNPILEKTATGMLLSMTLPNLPNAETTIPRLLTRAGQWEMRSGTDVILSNNEIASVQLSLDESGMPETLLSFSMQGTKDAQAYLDAHSDGVTTLYLDGEKIIDRPNSIAIADGFRLVSEKIDPRVRMQESADFVILLSNPVIPCEIQWENRLN